MFLCVCVCVLLSVSRKWNKRALHVQFSICYVLQQAVRHNKKSCNILYTYYLEWVVELVSIKVVVVVSRRDNVSIIIIGVGIKLTNKTRAIVREY